MADYEQEQEMELEALQAILMDDIKEIDLSESGIDTRARCFEILISPQVLPVLQMNQSVVDIILTHFIESGLGDNVERHTF
jgi:hypothetical protein